MTDNARLNAARAFARSLNILLKSVRLYGFTHERTSTNIEAAWSELRSALPPEGGFLLGVSGSQLLLDGVPLEAAPAERSFVELLSAAGLASIQFSSDTTHEDFDSFVRAFATAGGKPALVADHLRAALGEERQGTIRVNEIRFVAEDAGASEARVAAQLTARTLGADAEEMRAWLNDPQKLLQLIAAAEGARSGVSAEPAATPAEAAAPREEDVLGLMRLLTSLGQATHQPEAAPEPAQLQQQLAQLPATAQLTLQQALASLAAAGPTASKSPLLLQLAEHLAIHFALERYQRGEVRVNAVRELLGRMGHEIDTLRKLLGAHEEKMTRAGLMVESHADILDRQFWASVPESGKRNVLLSSEAWCIPPRNVAQFLEELLAHGDTQTADNVLLNYASCVHAEESEGRRRVALGLNELARYYSAGDGRLLGPALREMGRQLSQESLPELQTFLSATFVHLSQEAASHHQYPAIQQALTLLKGVETTHPGLVQSVRPRIGVEGRLADFVEEALRKPRPPEGLLEVLGQVPEATAEQLVNRFNRCARCDERERLVEFAQQLGPDVTPYLRAALRTRPPGEAAATVGLLSRLEAPVLEDILPARVRGWNRIYHDIVVRQLAAGAAPERGRMLLKLLDALDPLVHPEALDEIGLSGDPTLALPLMRLAGGDHPLADRPYLRLKAVEALGRLREPTAAPLLRRLVEAKQVWRWMNPRELRIVAAQALLKIDPGWTTSFLPKSGLTPAELAQAPAEPVPTSPWVRQRRYVRVPLSRTLPGVVSTMRGDCHLETKQLSLGGGLAASQQPLPPGTEARVRLTSGLRHLNAQVVVRDVRSRDVGFEIVDIELDDRIKLRHLLGELPAHAA